MYNFSSQKGLTLIETLVAVFIFSMSLVSLMIISSRGIQSITVATQRATAQFLAQEGIEIIEAIRDDNFLDINSTSWLMNLNTCINGNLCYISATDMYNAPQNTPQPSVCPGMCPTMVQGIAGQYGYDPGGDPTPFVRSIRILVDPSGEFARVQSVVEWERAGTPYSVQVTKHMMNWFQPTSATNNP